jgi:hypothetical protein
MNSVSNQEGTVLYKDSLVELTNEKIVFFRYYFPFGTAKTLSLDEIESIQSQPPAVFGGSWRIWGTGNFVTWFPWDGARPRRDRIFFVTLRNRLRRIGFTVEDSQKLTAALRTLGLLKEEPPEGAAGVK